MRGPRAADDRRLILFVEDSEADRDVYGGLLWYNGYDVEHATTGAEALAKALELEPDLIVVDVRLPDEMDGVAVARELRTRGVSVPIIMLSAVPRDELEDALRDAGADTYLEKSTDPFALVREVMHRIGQARPGES